MMNHASPAVPRRGRGEGRRGLMKNRLPVPIRSRREVSPSRIMPGFSAKVSRAFSSLWGWDSKFTVRGPGVELPKVAKKLQQEIQKCLVQFQEAFPGRLPFLKRSLNYTPSYPRGSNVSKMDASNVDMILPRKLRDMERAERTREAGEAHENMSPPIMNLGGI